MKLEIFKKEFERLTGYYEKIAKNENVNKQRAYEFYKKLGSLKESEFIKTVDLWIESEKWFPTPQALFEKGNFKQKEEDLKSCNFQTPLRKNKVCRKGLVFAYDVESKKELTFLCPNEHCNARKSYTKGYFKPYPIRQTGLYLFEDYQDMIFEALPAEKQNAINNFVAKKMKDQNFDKMNTAMAKKMQEKTNDS